MAKGPLKVLAYSQDNKIKLDEGKLALVNNEILQTTGTIQLKAEFPNTEHRLWPGELVNARLLLETRHNGITVAGVGRAAGPERYVCLCRQARPDGRNARRHGRADQRRAGADRSGLKPGESVVVDGQYRLQPGSRVTILHGKAARERRPAKRRRAGAIP